MCAIEKIDSMKEVLPAATLQGPVASAACNGGYRRSKVTPSSCFREELVNFFIRLMHCDPEFWLQSLCIAAADAMRLECPRDLCPKLQTIPACSIRH